MRKTILLLASMALAVILASGVALAATINCPNRAGDLCVGTDNRDFMYGTSTQDVMRGQGAADTLRARAGDDRLTGGGGDDKLGGGRDSDVYVFNDEWRGRDRITTGESSGVDTLNFSALDDPMDIDLAAEKVGPEAMRSSRDRLNFPAGVVLENVRGTTGSTYLYGNGASNRLWGNNGGDWLFGRAGKDTLDGGDQRDSLLGQTGDDALSGGDAADLYVFAGGWGHDKITNAGTPGQDRIMFSWWEGPQLEEGVTVDLVASEGVPEASSSADTLNFPPSVVIKEVRGSEQADVISGNAVDNELFGLSGNDELKGHAGNDHLNGQNGVDNSNGGQGNDSISDTVVGQPDTADGDTLIGAAGNDFLGGGLGADTLTGGPGTDNLEGDGPEPSGDGDDDTIYAIDGEADTIYCGGGIDTVHYDQGLDTFQEWPGEVCENKLTT